MYENRYLFLGLIHSVDLIYKMYRNYISYPCVICVMAGKCQPYWYSYYTIRDSVAVHYHTQWTVLCWLSMLQENCERKGGQASGVNVGMWNQYDWPSSTLLTAVSVLKF